MINIDKNLVKLFKYNSNYLSVILDKKYVSIPYNLNAQVENHTPFLIIIITQSSGALYLLAHSYNLYRARTINYYTRRK